MAELDWITRTEEVTVEKLVIYKMDESYTVLLSWLEECDPFEAFQRHTRYLTKMFYFMNMIKKTRQARRDKIRLELLEYRTTVTSGRAAEKVIEVAVSQINKDPQEFEAA